MNKSSRNGAAAEHAERLDLDDASDRAPPPKRRCLGAVRASAERLAQPITRRRRREPGPLERPLHSRLVWCAAPRGARHGASVWASIVITVWALCQSTKNQSEGCCNTMETKLAAFTTGRVRVRRIPKPGVLARIVCQAGEYKNVGGAA